MHTTESDPITEHGSSANSLNHVPELHSPHVCIVGAGISGLRCAESLIRHGMKVTIIEARDRIGGRVGSYIDFKLQILLCSYQVRSIKVTDSATPPTCKSILTDYSIMLTVY
jgi:uncharacterized protein with NAD-binding domain and iron-sulfur cluster